jgi:hypothetical protein
MHRLMSAVLIFALSTGVAATAAAQAPRLSIDDDTWLQFRFLAQLQLEAAEMGAGVDADRWSYDMFTRRARIIGSGSVHKNVKFLFSTDVPNAGKQGVPNELVWNDGFVDFQLAPAVNISIGRILLPFSPENRASAATLLGIDYNLNLLKVPTLMSRAFWRDDGIELRGVLAAGSIEYRGGVFKGARTFNLAGPGEPVRLNNPDNSLRTTGMAMINLADAQPGWFYNPNSLGTLSVLSFGGGFDRIPNSTADIDHSLAWNLFAIIEQPLAGGRLNAMAGYYSWDGPAWVGGFEGTTLGAQVGYLLPDRFLEGQWQPVVRFQRQDDTNAEFTLNTFNVGLNYLLKGHAANCKLDLAINDRRVAGEGTNAVRFQTQLFF